MKRAQQPKNRSISAKRNIQRAKTGSASSFESLETRVFLSGSVMASVVHGSLNISGGSAGTGIVLDQSGLNADQVRITGAADTTINKQVGPIIVSGVTRGVAIQMHNGADSIAMRDLTLAGRVTINAAGGNNTLLLDGLSVATNLSVHNSASFGATTIVDTTVGKDFVSSGAQKVALQSVQVQGKTAIVGGNHSDTLTIDNSTFHGDTRVQTRRGADLVQIGAHGAPLGSATAFDGKLRISLAGGNDTLQLGAANRSGDNSTYAGKVILDGGAGTNALRNFDTSAHAANPRFQIRNFQSDTHTPDLIAPTVISTAPAAGAAGVALNMKIAATFSEPMNASTISSSTVTVTGPGGTPVSGTVAYVGTTLTFTPDSPLAISTPYTLTVTTGAQDLGGNSLTQNFVSTFTTGSTTDVTAPTVISTDPTSGATGVALDQRIGATFSEAMDPLSITTANVIVTAPGQVIVSGTVTQAGSTLIFTPAAPLAASTAYTLTVTTGAKDLAGNSLATNFVSTFTTGTIANTTVPTVTATSPTDLKTNVMLNKPVAATFSKPIDPLSLDSNFTITDSGNTPVAGTVNYDSNTNTATFTPSSNLAPSTTFTARITGGDNGVAGLDGSPMASDKVWTFTTGTQVAQAPINLGAASGFAVMATAAISGTGAIQINGDVGLNPGTSEGIPPQQINGNIHTNDQAIINAQTDLAAAYSDAVSRSVTPVSLPGNMGGLTFTPGLYTNSSSVLIQGPPGASNNVTLDAQGDPNAIFIFKMGSTLTTGPGAQVILAGGAKASNIFWQVGSSATLDTTTIFKGNILANVTITVNNGSAVEGRLLAGSGSPGSVTVNGSTVTLPAA